MWLLVIQFQIFSRWDGKTHETSSYPLVFANNDKWAIWTVHTYYLAFQFQYMFYNADSEY